MNTYRLALIGFGNVGQGLATILKDFDCERFGADFKIVAVNTATRGSCYHPDGIAPTVLLNPLAKGGTLADVPALHHGWDALQTITQTNADIVIEMSHTNLETGEPATTHLRTALGHGKHVITTNKGPVALHYAELRDLAKAKGLFFGVEGTVMSGTPSLRLGMELLAAAGVTKVQGIINGTTNYILSQMEAGNSYASALQEAQALGYAEADPTGDVEGYDAMGKVIILANLLMNTQLQPSDVARQGISHLSLADIQSAEQDNKRWRLLGTLEMVNSNLQASVQPTLLPMSHPLAGVKGAKNAITYATRLMGEVTLIGAGAGRSETGYAVLEDLLAIHQRR